MKDRVKNFQRGIQWFATVTRRLSIVYLV